MQPAGDAERHRVLEAEPRPVGHAPSELGRGVEHRKLRADHARGARGAGLVGVVGLPGDRLTDVGDVHDRLVRHRRCPFLHRCLMRPR